MILLASHQQEELEALDKVDLVLPPSQRRVKENEANQRELDTKNNLWNKFPVTSFVGIEKKSSLCLALLSQMCT